MLAECTDSLASRYGLLMLDLDGVVYRGPDPVPSVGQYLESARALGSVLAYVTNNAARSPAQVAEHLRLLGVPATPSDVVTAGQAVAALVATELSPNSTVLVLGSPALAEAVAARGLHPVLVGAERWTDAFPAGVVSGFGPDLVWRDLLRAAVLIREGLPWWAANADLTFPADFGLAPGHGALVRMLSEYADVVPTVAGKPEPHLLWETMQRHPGRDALMIGDRLDTDIAAGARAGVDTLLVMTGVTGLAELVAAEPSERPTYVLDTLAGLTRAQGVPQQVPGGWRHGRWSAQVQDGVLRISSLAPDSRPDDPDWDTWWQLVCSASWAHRDRTGEQVRITGPMPPHVEV